MERAGVAWLIRLFTISSMTGLRIKAGPCMKSVLALRDAGLGGVESSMLTRGQFYTVMTGDPLQRGSTSARVMSTRRWVRIG